MKKFRFILVLAMAVVISGGVISTSRVVNAATDINFGSRTVDAGCARRWFPKGQTGYTLTNGQNQTISVTVSTRGNNIGIGFMKYSTKTNYSYYSGVLSGTTVTKKKALSGATASYQPYVENYNDTVQLRINSGYAKMQ